MEALQLKIKRIARKSEYTIGHLYIEGKYFCDTLEDYDRLYFGGIKVKGKTAIPVGTYTVSQNIQSMKYKNRKPYAEVCDGYVPRLLNVPQFQGILIHIGNTASDTEGCILVGKNNVVGKVMQSTATWKKLMREYMLPAKARGQRVIITIE